MASSRHSIASAPLLHSLTACSEGLPHFQQNFPVNIVASLLVKMMGDILARGPRVHRQIRQKQNMEFTERKLVTGSDSNVLIV